jgi:hypothetical protein
MRALPIVLATVLTASSCLAGSIGIYSEPDGMGCSVTIPQGGSAIVYVVGHTSAADPFGGGIDSGEFRIVGLPAGWTTSVTHAPAISVVIGNAFGDGVNLGWMMSQSGTIPMFSVQLTATSQVSNVVLQIVKHVHPAPPFGYPTTCPWFHYSCDAPCDVSGFCVDSVDRVINGVCAVGIEPATWSGVRQMYR